MSYLHTSPSCCPLKIYKNMTKLISPSSSDSDPKFIFHYRKLKLLGKMVDSWFGPRISWHKREKEMYQRLPGWCQKYRSQFKETSTWDNLSFNKGKNDNGFKLKVTGHFLKLVENYLIIFKTGWIKGKTWPYSALLKWTDGTTG